MGRRVHGAPLGAAHQPPHDCDLYPTIAESGRNATTQEIVALACWARLLCSEVSGSSVYRVVNLSTASHGVREAERKARGSRKQRVES